jgi:hypothetical protein
MRRQAWHVLPGIGRNCVNRAASSAADAYAPVWWIGYRVSVLNFSNAEGEGFYFDVAFSDLSSMVLHPSRWR